MTNRGILGVASAFTANIAGAGLGFLFSIILARLLGSSGTGVYFLALAIVSIGATIACLGLNNAVLRFASVAHSQEDRPMLASLFRQSTWLVIFAGVVICLLLWFVVPFIPLGGEKSSELHVVITVMLFSIIPMALIQVHGEFFKATGAPGSAVFIQSPAIRVLLVAGGVAFLFRGSATMHDVAMLYTGAAFILVLFVNVWWSCRSPSLRSGKTNFDIRLLLRTSFPLLWVASMNLVMDWTDILVLGALTNSNIVGVYGVAIRVAALTGMILVAAQSVIAPRFAALYAEGDFKALERLAQGSTSWMLLIVLPVSFVLLLFPEWILQLFGIEFLEGAAVLRILVIGQLVNVSMGLVGALLIMTGHERRVRNTTFYAIAINLVGNIVLVPMFGAIGAAISTAIALSVKNIILCWQVRKILKINMLSILPQYPSSLIEIRLKRWSKQIFLPLRSGLDKKVDFIVCGVQKGGTSAMYAYLRQHAEICMADEKEVHFFDNEKVFKNNCENYKLYHTYFLNCHEDKLRGEATPIYSYWKEAPGRIWKYNPRIKLILLLRNPIDRAYSHWNMEKSKGKEHLSFSKAIRTEQDRCREANSCQHRTYSYIDRGFYTEQLLRLYRFFPKEQLLILKNEDLRNRPDVVLKEVFNFLEVGEQENIQHRVVFSQSYKNPMEDSDKALLRDIFKKEISKLENMLGWDCQDWLHQ